jgi:hypothetical protein
LCASPNDRSRDTSRESLLAELKDYLGQIGLVRMVDNFRCGSSDGLIHAHVERAIRLKTETARRLIKLGRRHAEIEQYALHFRDTEAGEMPF